MEKAFQSKVGSQRAASAKMIVSVFFATFMIR